MSRLLMILSIIVLTVFSSLGQSLPRIALDTSLETTGFSVMNDYLNDKRIVLLGENHRYVNSNQLLKLKTIQYLHKEGFRYVTMEFGAGIGYLANEYVQTGDEKLLEILNGGFDENEKNHIHEFLLGIERFNRDKGATEKIHVKGVDYTRYPVYSLKALAYMLEEKSCEQEFYTFYEDLEIISSVNLDDDNLGFASRLEPSRENFDIRYGFKSYKNRLFELSIRNLVNDFYEDSTIFKNRLGEYYEPFSDVIEELKKTLDWYLGSGVDIQMHIERERHLADGIRAIVENDEDAKVTGQFGRCHTRAMGIDGDCYSFSMESMVKRLSKDSTLNEKIAVLPIYYKNEGELNYNRKNTDYKLEELLPAPGIYVYDLSDSVFIFDKVTSDSSYALINTYWSGSFVEEIIEGSEDLSRGRVNKRKENEEQHTVFTGSYHLLPNEISQDFGVDIVPEEQLALGMEFTNVDPSGAQNSLGFTINLPNNLETDSVDLRFTNWYIYSSVGYNIIYRQNIDVFANWHFGLGFAKIVERRGFEETIYTYSTQELKNVYRNPYFNVTGEMGFRLKFGWFGIQAQAGYQYDFTNPKWRYKTILPHSTGLNFRNFYGRAGILIRI